MVKVGLKKDLMPLYRRSRQPVFELSAFSLVLVLRARLLGLLHLEDNNRKQTVRGSQAVGYKSIGSTGGQDGGPGATRTPGLRIRSPTLYPTELRVHISFGVSEGPRTPNRWSHSPELCRLSYAHHIARRAGRAAAGGDWYAQEDSNLRPSA